MQNSTATDFVSPIGALNRTGPWAASAARNLDIITTLKALHNEGRSATTAEQQHLAGFCGWGASGIAANLFPSYGSGYGPWYELSQRLKSIMDADEIAAVRRSTQYAFYTPEPLARAMWAIAIKLGFTGGAVLDPGCGTGRFLCTLPEQLRPNTTYTGVEADPTAAQIAAHLAPRQTILQQDFVKTTLPQNFFDLAIGNPPFASVKITSDPAYRRLSPSLHDYFLAKSLDAVRPGGLVLLVTSRFTLDKKRSRLRQYISERADLVYALRLPTSAFEADAGVRVTTDILAFRKRLPGEACGSAHWVQSRQMATDARHEFVNSHFLDNPQFVLGRPHLAYSGSYHTRSYTVDGSDRPLSVQLAEAAENAPANVMRPWSGGCSPTFAPRLPAQGPALKDGQLFLGDQGQLLRLEGGLVRDLARTETLKPSELAWLSDYVRLRDLVKAAQRDQLADGDWESSLSRLQDAYERFSFQHGPIRTFSTTIRKSEDEDGNPIEVTYPRWKYAKLLQLDIESPMVEMLEVITTDGEIVKSPFLNGRTIKPPRSPQINCVNDALSVSLDQRGRLDLPHIAELAGRQMDEVIDELGAQIYWTPDRSWELADGYLSGDVRKKLQQAKLAASSDKRFERNVAALIRVQPKPLDVAQVSIMLGAPWVPADVVRSFAKEVLNAHVDVRYCEVTSTWVIDGGRRSRIGRGSGAGSEWGTSDRSPAELLNAALNDESVKIASKDPLTGKAVTDHDQTAAAREVVQRMRQAFQEWAWSSAARVERLLAIYNERFNNLAPRIFDGSHLTFPGLSLRFHLRASQKNAIWRIIQSGTSYIAHAVGAGKTLIMIVAAMEMRRLGLIDKPLFVVPNHLIRQFANEFMQAYPMACVMVADDRNFDAANRVRFAAQVALNSPDAVIMGHSAFGLLATTDSTREQVKQLFVAPLRAALDGDDEGADRYTVKRIERQLEIVERRFEAKGGGRKDGVVCFEDLGVDFLFVDEAHEFRRLDFTTRRSNLKGITPAGSARALDLFIKAQYLDAQRPGRAVVMASGTPIVNTMAELYSIMRLLDLRRLEEDGLMQFDAWASLFGRTKQCFEQNAAGQYEVVERFNQFVNVPDLIKRVRMFMDYLPSSELKYLVDLPSLAGGKPELIISHPSDALHAYLKGELAERIQRCRDWVPTRDEPHNLDPMINIITDGRLASIDLRFVRPIANDPDSKLNRMLDDVARDYHAFSSLSYRDEASGATDPVCGGVQLIYSAVGFGDAVAKTRGFDVRRWIVQTLTAKGVQRSHIAFMGDFTTPSARESLFAQMRAGAVRMVFGSPKNMGTGMNAQRRLKALYYLAPPWYPADVEQPHGRILRNGNQNDEVIIRWYAAKGTYDATQWRMVSNKALMIEQAMTGDDTVRRVEDVSDASQYEMAAALSAGDERAIELAAARAEIERLERIQRAFHSERQEAELNLHGYEGRLGRIRRRMIEIQEARQALRSVTYRPSGALHTANGILVAGPELTRHVVEGMVALRATWKGARVEDASGSLGRVEGAFDLLYQLERDEDSISVKLRPTLSIRITDAVRLKVNLSGVSIESARQGTDAMNGRLLAALETLRGMFERLTNECDDLEARIQRSKKLLAAAFPHLAELSERIARVAQLESELTAEREDLPMKKAA